ncbi:hypothetical protein H4R18_001242 [Coemansia javaensis]|uniref:Uncharacterized protein n=1 Tax=Coemansia javaensis TaxID=2761396 RepID=A0A9W8LLP0_9FUNG|nr:hypothetical protein H4R18_001242 [Coemansia javaensis]
MHLCDLPDDVLRPALQLACFTEKGDAHAPLKDNLPLLAVCRRLRALALAVVYSTASIQFGDNGGDSTAVQFQGNVRHYAGQLRVLRSDFPVIVPPGVALRKLESVYIPRTSNGDDQGLRVDPAELRVLRLNAWPENHSWAAFSADGDESQDIWFPRVQVLDLIRNKSVMASGSNKSGHAGRLHFPELKVLAVNFLYDAPTLLERGVFPARMDRLFIETAASTLLDTSSVPLPSARCIHITLKQGRDWSPGMAAAVQRTLNAARDCDEVGLTVYCGSLLLQPETLASAPLTRLSVMVRVHADIVVALIQGLPRLSSLMIRRLMGCGAWSDTSIPEPGADRLVEPVSSTLEAVQIWAGSNIQAPETVTMLARYLLLATPSLSYLSTIEAARQPIEGLVKERAHQYPRLAKTRFSYI